MRSLHITDVRDVLSQVFPGRVYHFHAPTEAVDGGGAYAVWGETSLGTASADNAADEWTPSGMIYIYTPKEYDGRVDDTITLLETAGITVSPGRIGWDDTTRMIAYEIGWTITCAPGELYTYIMPPRPQAGGQT